MTSRGQNDFLTRTGPGTPMGNLLRRYWIPAFLSSEIAEPDCPPVRVKLLGERLIAFRDSQGRIGVMDEFCAHRGASLWFGRNEENGLRCPYHGWKYDVTGQCIEVPSEPEESGFCRRIRLASYPLVERRSGSSRSACRNATGCRRWRAASTRATYRSCTAATSTPTLFSGARGATNT